MLHVDEAALLVDRVETPIGTLHLASRGGALCAAGFAPISSGSRAPIMAAARVRAYFEGDLGALDDLEVDPRGTPFQRAVWALLRKIPAGETRSYGRIAALLGSGARAVGTANAANPIALVIPCHRVIASSGALCGYAWGEERKRWLLAHERRAA